jgi:glycine/D-amino acid oxidase-like deaminating enzyme
MDKLSHWELEEYFRGVDVVVVGAGIVGLTTAIFLKEKAPRLKVLVLEAGLLPSGASTRNAGFACFGSLSELAADLRHSSLNDVLELITARYNGLLSLRALLGDAAICYLPVGGYEVFQDGHTTQYEAATALMERFNSELNHRLGLTDTYCHADAQTAPQGLRQVKHMILNRHEGSIDTGRLFSALYAKAIGCGVRVLCGLRVEKIEENGNGIVLTTSIGPFKAGHVHVATNGFAQQLLPDLDVRPARAQVLITAPVPGLQLSGTFHMDEGYFYFRNVGQRVLLGGGRNLAIEEEQTTDQTTTPRIQAALDTLLRHVILPHHTYTVEHRWAGTMGLGTHKHVIIRHLRPHITCSVRMGGMGVALGTDIGRKAADMVLSEV